MQHRYVSDTRDQSIQIANITYLDLLVAYSHANWAGDLDTSRLTSGYIVYLWGAPIIACQLRLQSTVAISTMKAEYMAAYKHGPKH